MTRRRRKGGIHDPVAQSIRNEQNRDAAPSPEEAEQEHRRFLESEGCRFCGETDPDKLDSTMFVRAHCPRQQNPYERIVYCDDCGFDPEEHRWNIRMDKVREEHVAIIVYECDSWNYIEEPKPPTTMVKTQVGYDENDDPIYEEQEMELPERPTPKGRILCEHCGSHIKEVRYLDEGSEE